MKREKWQERARQKADEVRSLCVKKGIIQDDTRALNERMIREILALYECELVTIAIPVPQHKVFLTKTHVGKFCIFHNEISFQIHYLSILRELGNIILFGKKCESRK